MHFFLFQEGKWRRINFCESLSVVEALRPLDKLLLEILMHQKYRVIELSRRIWLLVAMLFEF